MASYRDIHRPVSFAGGSETLLFGTIARRLHIEGYTEADAEHMDLPEYQRGHVWTAAQQEAFVGHMLEGGATPIVIFNRDEKYTAPDEVVDGKQRITAIGAWIQGEIAAELTDGSRVYLSDFNASDQRQIMGISGPHIQCGYVILDRVDVLRLYLRLNRGGTIHTEDEIDRVRGLLAKETT